MLKKQKQKLFFFFFNFKQNKFSPVTTVLIHNNKFLRAQTNIIRRNNLGKCHRNVKGQPVETRQRRRNGNKVLVVDLLHYKLRYAGEESVERLVNARKKGIYPDEFYTETRPIPSCMP